MKLPLVALPQVLDREHCAPESVVFARRGPRAVLLVGAERADRELFFDASAPKLLDSAHVGERPEGLALAKRRRASTSSSEACYVGAAMSHRATRRRTGAWFAVVWLGVVLFLRMLGAFAIHEHDGHSAHLHLVSNEAVSSSIGSAGGTWSAHAHAHRVHDAVHAHPHESDRVLERALENDVEVVSLPDDPVQASADAFLAARSASACATALAQISSTPNLIARVSSARPQPPDPPPPRGLRTFLDRTQNLRC